MGGGENIFYPCGDFKQFNRKMAILHRHMFIVHTNSLFYFRFAPKFESFRIIRHTLDRPWTSMYWSKNPAFTKEEAPVVLPIKNEDWMWFRGDRVEILTGPDKGKQVGTCTLQFVRDSPFSWQINIRHWMICFLKWCNRWLSKVPMIYKYTKIFFQELSSSMTKVKLDLWFRKLYTYNSRTIEDIIKFFQQNSLIKRATSIKPLTSKVILRLKWKL